MKTATPSNAEICRQRGWGTNTVIYVNNEYSAAKFILTAIGENLVLGKQIASMNFGFSWTTHAKPIEQVLDDILERARLDDQ